MATDLSTGLLTGAALQARIDKCAADIRETARIRSKNQIPQNSSAQGALRYLGKNLMGLATRVRTLFGDTYETGMYKGLTFTVADFDQAMAREADAQGTDTKIQALAQDAHAENVAARSTLAEMVMKIIQTREGLLALPGTEASVKTRLKTAGAHVDLEVATMKTARKGSRDKTVTLRGTEAALNLSQAEVQKLRTDGAVRDAQKDLKLQLLSGEPLRPDDLVMAGLGDDVPEMLPMTRTASRKLSTAAAPTAAKARGRRTSPRR